MGIDFGSIGKGKTSTEKTIENVEKSEEKKKTVKTTDVERKPRSAKPNVKREQPDDATTFENIEKLVSEKIDAAIAELRKKIDDRFNEIENIKFPVLGSMNVVVERTKMIMSRFMDEWQFIYPKLVKRWKNSPGFADKVEKMNELLGELNHDAIGNDGGT